MLAARDQDPTAEERDREVNQPPRGDGGMCVSPCTSGISSAKSSKKHQDHSSPGSSERMSGWPLLRPCALACRLGESSQQPTLPHSRQIRR